MKFYSEVLGCPEERRIESLGLIQLRAGRGLIDLVPVAGELGKRGGRAPGDEGRNMDHVALRIEVNELEAVLPFLDAHGVRYSAIERRYGAEGFGRSLYLYDPDGNVIELRGEPEHSR